MAMTLERINNYINRRLAELAEVEKSFGANVGEIKQVLQQIQFLLRPGDDTPAMVKKKIESALQYIAALPIEQGYIFSEIISFGNLFKKDQGILITVQEGSADRMQSDTKQKRLYYPTKLLDDDVPVLKSLCKALIELNRQPVWEYSYKRDGSGKVSNPMIKDWEREMASPAKEFEAYIDYKRDYKINGKNFFKDDESITAALKYLVSATGYEEKEKIVDWMRDKSGQRFNYLLNSMTTEHELGEWKPGSVRTVDVNWYAGKDGKIHVNYEIIVYACKNDNGEFLVAKQDGSVIKTSNPDHLKKSHDELPPAAMRISVKAELQIQGGEVKPVITELKLKGHSDMLPSPAKKHELQETTSNLEDAIGKSVVPKIH